jgi:cell division protein FtsI/penicillin-binding protein 2
VPETAPPPSPAPLPLKLRAAVTTATLSLVATIAACSSDPPEPPVDELAAALTSGDFSAVPLTGATATDAATDVTEISEGMADSTRTVTVGAVEPDPADENVRNVTFDVMWDLDYVDEAEWSYQTSGTFELTEEDEWLVAWSPTLLHPDVAAGDVLTLRREQAERAQILGAGDSVIVTDRPVFHIGIDKVQVQEADPAESATELAELVGVNAERFAERVESAGDKAFVEAITLREDDASDVLPGIEEIAGARALPDEIPLAPTRTFARPILGTVGDATGELVEESGGRVQPGDVTGLSGLQQVYDETLSGTPGLSVDIVPPEGDPRTVFEQDPVAGEPVTTTLDIDLQVTAENLLADITSPSAIVAVRPSTGEVVTAASGPGGEGYSTATLGQYAPGSTFKVISALALLRNGTSPDVTVACPATTTVDGREFGNYSDFPDSALGDISLRTAFAESCNTAFIGLRDSAPQAAIADAAAALGLTAEPVLGAPAFLGSVPSEAAGTAHAAALIGQGEVLASPLGMATVAASVAAGETVVPRIVADSDAGTPSGSLTPDEAQALVELMRAAVTDGTADFLADVPAEPVGAKTGTAEFGGGDPPDTHGWMIATQGDLAVAVFVEDAESGSGTAGPLLEEFLRAAS